LAALSALPLEQGQNLLAGGTPAELLRLFYPASQTAFLDEAGKPRFDTPEFEGFLETLYRIYSAQAMPSDAGGIGMGEGMQEMINGAAAFMEFEVSGPMQIATAYTIAGAEEGGFLPIPAMGGPSTAFAPVLLAGINANTDHPELAAEFVRSHFAPQLQSLDQSEGLPTVAAALDQMMADAKELSKSGDISVYVSFGDGNPTEVRQPDDATWDALRAVCDTLNTAYISDPTLMGFMEEETAAFFAGQGSAKDAAMALQQRAATYLNE
jgi:multiple sugar transport system substrate-binding protein